MTQSMERERGVKQGVGADPCEGASFCPHCGYDLRHDKPITVGDARFDPARGLEIAGRPVKLTVSERIVCQTLLKAGGAIVGREVLAARLDTDAFDRSIDAFVKRIRRKLEAVGARGRIGTDYGAGYRWVIELARAA